MQHNWPFGPLADHWALLLCNGFTSSCCHWIQHSHWTTLLCCMALFETHSISWNWFSSDRLVFKRHISLWLI